MLTITLLDETHHLIYVNLENLMLESHTLLYRSVSVTDSPDVIHSIWSILNVSHENNSRDGLTGLLVYDQGKFFQVLEGGAEPVKECYSRILSDCRHKDVETLINKTTPVRKFYRWSMGFIDAYELDDYLSIHEGLRSTEPDEVFESMVQIGCEHGLIQRATS